VISFVGAGPGAADLITLRGRDRLAAADVVVWASSLVPEELLDHAPTTVEVHDSAGMTLEDVLAVYTARCEARIVRLHSGDPVIYGAIQEQVDWCVAHERDFEIVPGVSSLGAAAAAVQRELTIPTVAQSVVLTRLGGRTAASMPERESVAAFAAHGTTMAVFLSAARSGQLAAELLEGGYGPDTPVIVAHQATWPEELVLSCTVGTLEATVKEHKLWKHTLFLVGPALSASGTRSHLYHPGHFHGFRRADPAARKNLREAQG
jgi:precorrin-4/cobalt-precorrin-4 C11-methyltransferase